MEKSKMMKIVSILLILWGGFTVFSQLDAFGDNASLGIVGITYSVLGVTTAVLFVVAGVLGIQKRDNLALCKKLTFLIILLAVLSDGVLGFVMINMIAKTAGAPELGIVAGFTTSILALIFKLVLPVLFLRGIRRSAYGLK